LSYPDFFVVVAGQAGDLFVLRLSFFSSVILQQTHEKESKNQIQLTLVLKLIAMPIALIIEL